MSAQLGIAVTADTVRAVVLRDGKVTWAASAAYSGTDDLADVLARLASEGGPGLRRVRIVLERDMVQLRSLDGVPLRAGALRRHVALQAPRLFRNGHGPVASDVVAVALGRGRSAALAAAAPESVCRAIVQGCAAAGLALEYIAPAAEPLGATFLRPADATCDVRTAAGLERLDGVRGRVWRSRRLRQSEAAPATHPGLAELGERATEFTAAFAAARGRSRLNLIPSEVVARNTALASRRLRRLAVAAVVAWVAMAVTYAGRMRLAAGTAARELEAIRPAAESALVLRRDLNALTDAVATIREAERGRSRHLELLGALSAGLGDSVALVSLRIGADSAFHLAGYAPVADRVVATLERMPGVAAPRLDGPPGRQRMSAIGLPRTERDRFAISARLRGNP